MTQPHTVHSFSTLPPTPTASLPPIHQCELHPPLSQDIIIQLNEQQHEPQYPPTAPRHPPTHTPIQPPKPPLLGEHIPSYHQYNPTTSTPPHTHTHTQSTDLTNTQPAPHTHWLNPIPNHPVTQPPLTIKSKYSHPTHCTPSPSENIQSPHPNHPTLSTIPTIHWFNHIVNQLNQHDTQSASPLPCKHTHTTPFPNRARHIRKSFFAHFLSIFHIFQYWIYRWLSAKLQSLHC